MKLDYMVLDVFTSTRFGGNPLAVVFDADELSSEQMQLIAREFNFSETSFVLKPKDENNTAHVRIFTTTFEMPFAGHPNVGTGFALANRSEQRVSKMIFEEIAGLVEVDIVYEGSKPARTSITAPLPLSVGDVFNSQDMAAVLSLQETDIVTSTHSPQVASVGMEFIIVEVASRKCLKNLQIDAAAMAKLDLPPNRDAIYIYTRDTDDTDVAKDWEARMFSFEGILVEDPATGSASGAAVALVASLGIAPKHGDTYCLSQGVDMGRPSDIFVKMQGEGAGARAEISGNSVMVMQGEIEV